MSRNDRARKALIAPWMFAAAACLLASVLAWPQPLAAGVPTADEEEELTEAEDDAGSTVRRLPPYYGDVVNDAQKEAIYRIQAQYAEQIEALKAQLRKVVAERDTAIEALLTEDQRKQVARAAADRQEELEILRKFREQRAQQRGEEAGN